MMMMSSLKRPSTCAADDFNDDAESTTSSVGEELVGGVATVKKKSRNESEKNRRDRLNSHIRDLRDLLPVFIETNKKLDKQSILRLASNFLRIHLELIGSCPESQTWRPNELAQDNFSLALLESLGGFLMILSKRLQLVFASEGIQTLLGHSLLDILGHSMEGIIHPDDRDLLLRQFDSADIQLVGSKNINSEQPPLASGHRSCYLRLKNICHSQATRYDTVHLVGHLKKFSHHCNNMDSTSDVWLISVAKLVTHESINEMPASELKQDQWITRHDLDGKITYSDHRAACLTGFFPLESIGLPAYSLLHPDDISAVVFNHNRFLSTGFLPPTIFRIYTKSRSLLYVCTNTYLALDNWTSQPKYIVSLNEVLDNDEGAILLDKQRDAIRQIEKSTAQLSIKSEEESLEDLPDKECRTPDSPSSKDPGGLKKKIKKEDDASSTSSMSSNGFLIPTMKKSTTDRVMVLVGDVSYTINLNTKSPSSASYDTVIRTGTPFDHDPQFAESQRADWRTPIFLGDDEESKRGMFSPQNSSDLTPEMPDSWFRTDESSPISPDTTEQGIETENEGGEKSIDQKQTMVSVDPKRNKNLLKLLQREGHSDSDGEASDLEDLVILDSDDEQGVDSTQVKMALSKQLGKRQENLGCSMKVQGHDLESLRHQLSNITNPSSTVQILLERISQLESKRRSQQLELEKLRQEHSRALSPSRLSPTSTIPSPDSASHCYQTVSTSGLSPVASLIFPSLHEQSQHSSVHLPPSASSTATPEQLSLPSDDSSNLNSSAPLAVSPSQSTGSATSSLHLSPHSQVSSVEADIGSHVQANLRRLSPPESTLARKNGSTTSAVFGTSGGNGYPLMGRSGPLCAISSGCSMAQEIPTTSAQVSPRVTCVIEPLNQPAYLSMLHPRLEANSNLQTMLPSHLPQPPQQQQQQQQQHGHHILPAGVAGFQQSDIVHLTYPSNGQSYMHEMPQGPPSIGDGTSPSTFRMPGVGFHAAQSMNSSSRNGGNSWPSWPQ